MKYLRNPLLLIIDAQQGIDEHSYWGTNRNNPQAEENIARLLAAFRSCNFTIIHVQHCLTNPFSPLRAGQKGHHFKKLTQPWAGELIVQKSQTNAFIGTQLNEKIIDSEASEVIITGFITNNSVEATARMAGNLDYKTLVVSDATATFDKIGIYGEKYEAELVHHLSLANINEEYATIVSTKEVVESLSAQ